MSTATTNGVIVAMPDTPDWHAARSSGIGASEIAAAVGLSPYEQPLELYLRKRGALPDVEENDAMRLGKLLEPVVLSEFTHHTGIEVAQYPVPMMRHPEHDWMLATIDALTADGAEAECKTIGGQNARKVLGDESTDELPESWLCQVQGQLCVTGLEIAHVAVLIDGRQFRHYTVPANKRLQDSLLRKLAEFWQMVQEGTPPEPDWAHSTTPQLMAAMYPNVAEGEFVRLPDTDRERWEQYVALGEQIKMLEEERSILKAQVQSRIGEANGGILDGERMVKRIPVGEAEVSYTRKASVRVMECKIPKSLQKRLMQESGE